jgi:5-enolpyruvylshikimate-3-phosphate synthase
MATKRKATSWIKQIEKRMDAVAKERDRIDEMIVDLSDLKEDCENAYDSLMVARDALSEMV